jgi:hypothetical protein
MRWLGYLAVGLVLFTLSLSIIGKLYLEGPVS